MTTSNKKNKKQKTSPGLRLWTIVSCVLLFFIIGALLTSCKSKQAVVKTSQISIEKDKLTPVAVPGDSSMLRALFKCDSLNNVLLVGFSEQKSKNMNSNFSFQNGQLSYKAETQPDTVFIKSTDKYYRQDITKTLTVTKKVTVIKEKPVRGFLWWTGLLFYIALTAFAGFKLVTKTPIISVFKKLLKII